MIITIMKIYKVVIIIMAITIIIIMHKDIIQRSSSDCQCGRGVNMEEEARQHNKVSHCHY